MVLLNQPTLEGIVQGKISLVFRNWKRPTVKGGGTLNTNVGQLAIESVENFDRADLAPEHAKAAGFGSVEELKTSLRSGEDRQLYRVEVRYLGADPRIALRQQNELSPEELRDVEARLSRMNSTIDDPRLEALALLRLLAENEAIRAPDLAADLNVETKWFKNRIRRLKTLGLTESLRIGYRVSPRGQAVLDSLT